MTKVKHYLDDIYVVKWVYWEEDEDTGIKTEAYEWSLARQVKPGGWTGYAGKSTFDLFLSQYHEDPCYYEDGVKNNTNIWHPGGQQPIVLIPLQLLL